MSFLHQFAEKSQDKSHPKWCHDTIFSIKVQIYTFEIEE